MRRIGIRWGLHWAFRGDRIGGCSRLIGTCRLGSFRGALGPAHAFLYTGGGASGAPPAADRIDAGSGLPDNPVSASLRVDSCWGAYGSRTDRTSLYRSARKWNQRLIPISGDDELAALNGLLEHRVLAICVLLSAHDALSFTRLKQALTGRQPGRAPPQARRFRICLGLPQSATRNMVQPDNALGRSRLKQQIDSLTQLIDRADA